MGDETRLAYNFALELAKQLITLSSALLVLTVAITKDLVKVPPTRSALAVMASAWACFFFSIVCGAAHIMGLTSSLEYASLTQAAADTAAVARETRRLAIGMLGDTVVDRAAAARHGLIIGPSARGAAALQIGAFLTGVLLTAVYGFLSLLRVHLLASPSQEAGPETDTPPPKSPAGPPGGNQAAVKAIAQDTHSPLASDKSQILRND